MNRGVCEHLSGDRARGGWVETARRRGERMGEGERAANAGRRRALDAETCLK